jgi:hypothetical protein
MRIATGEEPEDYGQTRESEGKNPAAVALYGLQGAGGSTGQAQADGDCPEGGRVPANAPVMLIRWAAHRLDKEEPAAYVCCCFVARRQSYRSNPYHE